MNKQTDRKNCKKKIIGFNFKFITTTILNSIDLDIIVMWILRPWRALLTGDACEKPRGSNQLTCNWRSSWSSTMIIITYCSPAMDCDMWWWSWWLWGHIFWKNKGYSKSILLTIEQCAVYWTHYLLQRLHLSR